jgi:hypothetical protein
MDITNTYWTNRGWQSVILKTPENDEDDADLSNDYAADLWEDGDDEWDSDDDDIQSVDDLVETIDDLFDIIDELLEDDDTFVVEIYAPKKDKKKVEKKDKDDDYDRAMKGL